MSQQFIPVVKHCHKYAQGVSYPVPGILSFHISFFCMNNMYLILLSPKFTASLLSTIMLHTLENGPLNRLF